MEIEGIRIDDIVDITDKVCPLTFVKAKVAIDELEDGEVIAIRMNDGEPVQNVPRSIKEEGHQILKLVNNEDGTYNLIVKKVQVRCFFHLCSVFRLLFHIICIIVCHMYHAADSIDRSPDIMAHSL